MATHSILTSAPARVATPRQARTSRTASLPLGVGLVVAASASLGLWTGIALVIRALVA